MHRSFSLTKAATSAIAVGSVGATTAASYPSSAVNPSDVKITDVKVFRWEEEKDKAVFVSIKLALEQTLTDATPSPAKSFAYPILSCHPDHYFCTSLTVIL